MSRIERLYEEGINMREISRRTGETYYQVYSQTRIKERGFKSSDDYQKSLARKRKNKAKNREFSCLLTQRLGELGKSRRWLARQIGCQAWTICLYARGNIIPKEENLKKIYSALGLGKASGKNLEGFLLHFRE